MIKVITCAQWGARPVDNTGSPQSRVVGVVIHHTAGPNARTRWPAPIERQRCASLARAIQRDHMERQGWKDSGHHALVTRSGLVLEGRTGSWEAIQRGIVIQGAHAGDAAVNRTHFGIECEGNTELAPLTDRQWAALVELCAQVCLWGDVQSANLFPHSQFRPTECPGSWLRLRLPALRDAVHLRKLDLLRQGPR